MRLKAEIYVHFQSKEQLTMHDAWEVSAVCVWIYLYHLYKENTWMLCQVRNVLHLHPRAKESRPHVLFLAKCIIGQRS